MNRIKKGIRGILIGCALAMPMCDVFAQGGGIGYTQYMYNLCPINPAYSLLENGGVIDALVRRQYVGLDGAPNAVFVNGSVPIPSIGGTVGMLALNDKFAVEQTTEVSAFFAKGIQLSNTEYLGVSISAGVKRYTANYSTLDATDPSFTNDIRETQPTLGFGVLYYSEKYYIGISMPKLSIRNLGTASAQNRTDLKNHYYFSAGYLLPISDDLKLKPTALAMYASEVPWVGDLSATLYIKDLLGIGADVRTNKQMAGLISINTAAFRLGYSYQVFTSSTSLNGFSNATHEISLGFRFGKNLRNKLL